MKRIDRLELTRKNSKFLRERNNDIRVRVIEQPQVRGDICPNCGSRQLHHVEGCMTCAGCGWSACGLGR